MGNFRHEEIKWPEQVSQKQSQESNLDLRNANSVFLFAELSL